MEDVVKNLKCCVILTNIIRHRYVDPADILRNDIARTFDSQKDFDASLTRILEYHKKYKIILYFLCGTYVNSKFAQYIHTRLMRETQHPFKEIIIPHPSYIMRFKQNIDEYKSMIYRVMINEFQKYEAIKNGRI
jgi:hypothetical protein